MKKRGFTLIELLIVVAIIAILAAIAVPNFLEAQTRSKVARTKSDMRTLATALEAYRVDDNKYPPMADYCAAQPNLDYWTNYGSGPNDPFHSRMPNFLTTPIAYTSSALYDVFIDKNQPIFTSGRYPAETRVGYRYVYFNYYQLNSMKRAALTGGWVFYSLGPDKQTNQTIAPNGVYLRYDATNGTISTGNILRTQVSSEGSIGNDPTLGTPNGQN